MISDKPKRKVLKDETTRYNPGFSGFKKAWTILCELNRCAEVALPYFKAKQIFKGFWNTGLPKF
jgi:hypothetical protein